MRQLKFIAPASEKPQEAINAFDVMLDPIRSKILFEIILKGETIAEKLIETTRKSRSTISHHLKILVEAGILDVYMNPTGKVKYYHLSKKISDFMYQIDKKAFSLGTPTEQSDFILDLYKMFAIINLTYSNIFSEQIKLLERNTPFSNILMDEKEHIRFQIGKKKIELPYLTFFLTGEKEAEYFRTQLEKILQDIEKTIKENSSASLLERLKQPKHIVNLQIFPYVDEKEIK